MDSNDFLKRHFILQALYGVLYVALLFAQAQTAMASVFLILAPVLSMAYFIFYRTKSLASADLTVLGRLAVFPLLLIILIANGQDPFGHNALLAVMFCLDVGGSVLHCLLTTGLTAAWTRTWDVYLRKKTLEAVEAFVIMGGGVFFIIHAAIVSPPLGLSLSFFGCWYIGIIFFCFACNEEGYDKKSAIMYRVGVAAGLLYTSEMMGINTVTFRVQAIVVLLGCVGPWFGIVSECIGVLFLYNDTVSHLANVEDGIFYWCIFAGLGLVIGASFVQVFLMYDEFNYDQRKYLMRLHRQDYFMGFFCMALAGALQQGNNLDEGTLGCWLAKWAPMIFLAFTNLSKNLIRRKSAPPHHPTWWVDNTFQFQDDSEFVNVSFSIVTALATVGLTILVVIALVNCIGLDKMLMSSDSLSLFCIMHGFVMASYSGFWMIFAASGMPPHGRAKMFRIFPPGTDGPILACDPKNCVNPHIFDLFFGILIVLFGAFVFTNYELNAALTDLVKRVIIGLWVISISWKVVVHIQDYGYVPAHTPNPFDEFKRIDQEAKEKRENKKRGEQQPNEQTLLSEK